MTDPRQWHACTRKRRFKTEKNALEALKKIAKSGKLIPPSANAYKCKYCSGWHLGHKKMEES